MPLEFEKPISKKGMTYSPVQVRRGIIQPDEASFPPYDVRVSQDNYPLPDTLRELTPMRATLQTNDKCQLRCDGCYVKEWTDPHGKIRLGHDKTEVSPDEITDQLNALGDGLQDIYPLGVEPTLDIPNTKQAIEFAKSIGATCMSITNGASGPEGYDNAFREALYDNSLYKIIISVDSMDKDVHNRLRGRNFAFEKTLETIRHAIEKNDPIKINMTIWPDNYPTIIDSVQQLYDMGVRGFAFHCGSVEGIPDLNKAKLSHLDPLAWRALCAKLIAFRDSHKDELRDFTIPYIFFTKQELDEGIIGTEDGVRRYEEHLLTLGQGVDKPSPVRVCPSLDIPQVYVFSLDGKLGRGAISLCNIHTVGANRTHGDTYFADYDPAQKEFIIRESDENNELELMRRSRFLCPAREYAMGDKNPSDKITTESGDLYHACRYVSANQFPVADTKFGSDSFDAYVKYYQLRARAIKNVPYETIIQIESTIPQLEERISKLTSLL